MRTQSGQTESSRFSAHPRIIEVLNGRPDDIVSDLSPGTLKSTQTSHEQFVRPSVRHKDEDEISKAEKADDAIDTYEEEPQWTGRYAKWAGEPPDGGLKAWMVIFATALTSCSAFGYVTAWGIFQDYYETVLLNEESPSAIAWIGSVQYALIFAPAVLTGRLFDIGFFRIPFFIGSCLLIVCTFLIAECKVYWQFFLAQGLGIGIACGMLFGPSLGIASHWFKKRRALALGITAIGASIGGVIFPVMAQKLIPEVGFKWTMRIFGFLLLFMLCLANLLIDRRIPPMKAKGGLINWTSLKNPAYAIYCISGTTTFLGMYTVSTYIPVSAIQSGVSSDFAFYFVAIINASSAFARVVSGFLADRTGALNIMIPFTLLGAVMTFVWPVVKSEGGLIAIAVVYGLAYGTYISLVPVPAISMGPMNDVGRRIGLFLTFASLGALGGPPISGAINTATGGFSDVGYWGGAMLLFSVMLMILVRHLHLGKFGGKF